MAVVVGISMRILSIVCEVISDAIKALTSKPYIKSIFTFINGLRVRFTWAVKHKLDELRRLFILILFKLFLQFMLEVCQNWFVLNFLNTLNSNVLIMTADWSLTKFLDTRLKKELCDEACLNRFILESSASVIAIVL